MKNITVLVSGNGSNLQRIIDAVETGEIPLARINLVVADRDCFGLERAKNSGIPHRLIKRGKSFSEELQGQIPRNTDLIVLAGFLSILNEEFCKNFEGKIINIHPALLPAYGGKGMWGMNVHRTVLANGEKETGATVHFVTPGIDEGQIIIQEKTEISHEDDPETVAQKVHDLEYQILPQAIRQILGDQHRFAFVTDFHFRESHPLGLGATPAENWKEILEYFQTNKIENLIIGGDISEKTETYPEFFDDLKPFSWNLIYGNHDVVPELNEKYLHNGKAYGKGENEFFKFIFLDTSSYRLPQEQLEFLETQLVSTKKIIIYIHHPVLDVDSYMDRKHPLKNRDEVLDILLKSRKPVYLICGHYHNAYRSVYQNITQIISPAVSYQIAQHPQHFKEDVKNFGYTELELKGDVLETRFVWFTQKQSKDQ